MTGGASSSPTRTAVAVAKSSPGPVCPLTLGEPLDASAARRTLADAAVALLDERRLLETEEIAALAAVPDDSVTSLAALAHEVRLTWCGPEVEVEGIVSAKTGGCPEDCHFCAQSSAFETPVKATAFLEVDEVLRAARETAAVGASEFCIVLAVRGPDERTLRRILELVPLVRGATGLNVAVSAGILNDDQARRLAECGVHRYNHNLETARSFFGRVVTTHTWEERVSTCELVRAHGMELCCGALLGMGESAAQRVELALQLRALDPAEVPLNFLNPRPGTPLGGSAVLGAWEAIRWIALFRLAMPAVILRYAGGREVTLRDLQAMGMTAGINALIVGNYLTTLGRAPADDLRGAHTGPGSRPLSADVSCEGSSRSHCTGCGRPASECGGCGRELDPPRFCPRCGLRVPVVVTPAGYRARCRDHGEL
jgi:biotin synthase